MIKGRKLTANKLSLTIVAVVTAVIFLFNACDTGPHVNTAEEDIAAGKQLSEKYCQSCHRYPEPSLLDKDTWARGIMPQMAKQLGIQSEMGGYYADEHSAINMADWQRIMAFYQNAAPAKLTIPAPDALQDMAIFKVRLPRNTNQKAYAMTSMIKADTFTNTLYTADAANNLLAWDKSLGWKLVKTMPSAVSGASFYKDGAGKSKGVFSCIGVLPPNDYLKGSMEEVDLAPGKHTAVTLTDSLPRPVFTASGDFNKDGLIDYIVCGYGNTRGGLYLIEQQPDHKFKKKVIRGVPGAIQVEVGDFNNDGWPDVMCLFAQADEGVWMFLNDKKGGFSTKNLMRFPPVYGTNSFQLVDVNHDELKDIVYTCGDNNDYSSVLKPYHGVYIFTNQGNWNFKQTYFYHINGASKVIAADFDGDGDQDLAVIAFFPDFKAHPTEGFTYFEQTAPGKYRAHQLPINKYGRWIAMEVWDIDQDGDQDIILGNFSIYGDRLINQKDFTPNWDMHEPIIVLENISKPAKLR